MTKIIVGLPENIIIRHIIKELRKHQKIACNIWQANEYRSGSAIITNNKKRKRVFISVEKERIFTCDIDCDQLFPYSKDIKTEHLLNDPNCIQEVLKSLRKGLTLKRRKRCKIAKQ